MTSVNHTSTRSKGTPAPLVVVASMESINQTCVLTCGGSIQTVQHHRENVLVLF